MPFENLTREFFDTLILVVIIIGMALAAARLYRDFTRPLPGDPRYQSKRDTQPVRRVDAHENEAGPQQ
jgi:hypothetical protein